MSGETCLSGTSNEVTVAMAAAAGIKMREFQPVDADAFRRLNEDWIEKYFGMEEQDHLILDDPEGHILARGGHIFVAVAEGKVIGCCALILQQPGVFELGKMAVAEEYRGQGIGRRVLEYTIAQARALGAKSLTLGSNTKLANAVHLYESLGFRHVAPENIPPSPYARANVFMELQFQD
jgi:putative acetyltransferase